MKTLQWNVQLQAKGVIDEWKVLLTLIRTLLLWNTWALYCPRSELWSRIFWALKKLWSNIISKSKVENTPHIKPPVVPWRHPILRKAGKRPPSSRDSRKGYGSRSCINKRGTLKSNLLHIYLDKQKRLLYCRFRFSAWINLCLNFTRFNNGLNTK